MSVEKTLKEERMYDGKIISVRRDSVLLPNGKESVREIVEHPGGVGIALEDTDGTFFMVTQFRYGQGKDMLEFPAGKLEKGEDAFEAIQREVVEETGYTASNYYLLGTMAPTPAYDMERIGMYYAKVDEYVGTNYDEDEFIEVSKYTLDAIIEKIITREIEDAKTIAMALMVKEAKERKLI